MVEEEYDEPWYIVGEGEENYTAFDYLKFEPSERRNLLGHVAEWSAQLADWQVQILECMGDNLRIEWGVFMCPATLIGDKLVINTEGVW